MFLFFNRKQIESKINETQIESHCAQKAELKQTVIEQKTSEYVSEKTKSDFLPLTSLTSKPALIASTTSNTIDTNLYAYNDFKGNKVRI